MNTYRLFWNDGTFKAFPHTRGDAPLFIINNKPRHLLSQKIPK